MNKKSLLLPCSVLLVSLTMPTFDEILTEEGYHCEYFGKWHSHSTRTKVNKNPKQAAQMANQCLPAGMAN